MVHARKFDIETDYSAIQSLFESYRDELGFYPTSIAEALSGVNDAYYEGSEIIALKDDPKCVLIIETIGNYLTINQIKHDILSNSERNAFLLFL